MNTTASSVTAPDAPPSMTFLERFVGVFFSLVRTLEDVGRRPDFALALIIDMIAGGAEVEIVLNKLGTDRFIHYSLGNGAGMPSAPFRSIAAVIIQLAGPAEAVLNALFLAVVAVVILKRYFHAKVRFKTAFSVVCYGNLVTVIRPVMAFGFLSFVNRGDVSFPTPLPTGLPFFLSPDVPRVLSNAAGVVDVFVLWSLAIIAFGLARVVDGKVGPYKLFLAFLVVHVVLLTTL